eukprot:6230716-Amphidinium_carterae.3
MKPVTSKLSSTEPQSRARTSELLTLTKKTQFSPTVFRDASNNKGHKRCAKATDFPVVNSNSVVKGEDFKVDNLESLNKKVQVAPRPDFQDASSVDYRVLVYDQERVCVCYQTQWLRRR